MAFADFLERRLHQLSLSFPQRVCQSLVCALQSLRDSREKAMYLYPYKLFFCCTAIVHPVTLSCRGVL